MPEMLRSAAVLGLRFLFLTRYSWLLALVLVALPPFALSVAPSLLENLFVLDRPVQVLHVSWIAMFCSASVIGTLRITALNAIDRFEDYRQVCVEFQESWGTEHRIGTHWYQRWEGWLTLLVGLAAAIGIWYVIITACVTRTAADPGPGWGEFASVSEAQLAVSALAWRQALLGAGITLGILGAVYALLAAHQIWFAEQAEAECAFHSRQPNAAVRPPNPVEEAATDCALTELWVYRFLARLLGPGYFREVVYRRVDGLRRQVVLAPGHASLMLSTALFLGWYARNYWSVLGEGKMPDESSAMPALFFGLLSLLLVILVLPGISFLLDRHRIPILPTLLLIMAAFYGVFATDHYYELNPSGARAEPLPAEPIEQVYDRWKLPVGVGGQRTLVVIDASGGGIQASAWTAQVLTGLHEIYGDGFSRSVGLISAVSGGSVGTMFYLVNRADAAEKFDPSVGETVLTHEAILRIRDASRASGLEASCWGIAYPDTMRALFPPFAGRTIDRGWSIEQIWRERMSQAGPSFSDMRLSELGRLTARNQLPVAAFNSTLVETGQRLVISPVLGPPVVGESTSTGWEFLRAFPHSHLRVSTAARLSATFPYVTPVSRPLDTAAPTAISAENPLATFHVADGAYADNEGVVTSVDWINRLLVHYSRGEHLERRPFDRVLLIRIQAFPRQQARRNAANGSLTGWRAALLGPFDAMMHVRSASQTERGDLEINLLTRATLAEFKAARERTESEFQMALAQVEQLESIREELYNLAAAARDSPADVARQYLEVEDKLHAAEGLLRRAQERGRRVNDLLVESVVFDFQPVDQVRIPMSWKLTTSQKRQLDRAWLQLVEGRLQFQPLDVLDRYFARIPPEQFQPTDLPAVGPENQSSLPRASSGQISASLP